MTQDILDHQLPVGTLERSDPAFDKAVLATSFGIEDPGKRPDMYVPANTISDVKTAVLHAEKMGWQVSCCSGGHAWSQNHIREGGMLIDLSGLNDIQIDASAKTAEIGPACLSGDLDAALVPHKLFFPVAHAYTVGMGGFLLQGGYGWNSRVDGMACQLVTAADVVLADGRVVHCSETENADIFWSMRGSGPGFFGIVVRFYLTLKKRPAYTGLKMQVFRIKHLDEVVRWAHEIGPTLSPKVEFQMVFNRKAFGIFSHGIEVVTPVLADSKREAKELLAFIDKSPIRKKASITLPLISLALGRIMKVAEKIIFLPKTRWHCDNVWLTGPIEPALPTLRDVVHAQPSEPSHILWFNWNPASRDRPDMAFSLEHSHYLALYGGLRGKKWQPKDRDWATNSAKALEPYSGGSQLGDENLARRTSTIFMKGISLEKLEKLRKKYDPNRRFHSFGSEQA